MPHDPNRFEGYAFSEMSNDFLVECFDVLSVRSSHYNNQADAWRHQWGACKAELMRRLASYVS
jgi:hypothetical protein